jgi:hypothetical protein
MSQLLTNGGAQQRLTALLMTAPNGLCTELLQACFAF